MPPMYTLRPITTQERAAVEEAGLLEPAALRWSRIVVFTFVLAAFAFITFAGCGQVVVETYWPQAERAVAAASLVVFLAALVVVARFQLRAEQARCQQVNAQREAYRRELAAERVESARFRPLEVVEIAMLDPQQPRYCYRVSPTQAIILRTGDDPGHPGEEFELVRLPESKVIIASQQYGGSLEPAALLPADTDQFVQPDGVLFEVDWQELLAGRVRI